MTQLTKQEYISLELFKLFFPLGIRADIAMDASIAVAYDFCDRFAKKHQNQEKHNDAH